MPGKGHIPELTERIVRSMKANTNRTAGGLGSNASPGLTRDRIAASARTSSGVAPSARSSKVDWFEVTGTGTSSFVLTFNPIRDSWNVELGGVGLNDDPDAGDVEYQIVGKTLTITDPADTFRGVATQAPPWRMRVQYDYLSGAPTAPGVDATFPQTVGVGETTPTLTFATAPAAGSSVLLFYKSKFGGAVSSISGCGATWVKLADYTNTTGGGSPSSCEVWLGTGCSGSGAVVTVTSGPVFGVHAVEVSEPLTATGFQYATGGFHSQSVTASGAGVGFASHFGGAGVGYTPDVSGWTALSSPGTQDLDSYVRATQPGEVNEIHTNGINAFSAAIAGVVKYA